MNRIAPLEPPYDAQVSEDLTKLMPPGMPPIALFRTLAHNPRVLRRVRKGGLLDRGSITLRQRELVILRTCALCGSEYEWGVHVAFFARAASLEEAEVAATVSGRRELFAEPERVLLELCDALHATAKVDEALWERLRRHYRAEQLVELVALVGQYHTISFLTNALGVAPEPGAPAMAAAPSVAGER